MCLKLVFCTAAALTLAVCTTVGQVTVTNTFTVNQAIPDGQLTGLSDTRILSFTNDHFTQITDLQVNLRISGGFNGDFYGYLVHSSGFSILLNRSGRATTNSPGYSDTGFDVTFADGGNDIHFYHGFPFGLNGGGQLTNSWAPDGRYADPSTVSETDSPTSLLGSFNGTDPSGSWTLFLADVDFGQEGNLVQWGLVITAIPEPSSISLLGLGGLGLMFLRRRRSGKRS